MAVLGIIILLGVGVVTATVVANGSDAATLNLVGFDVTTTVAGIFGVGALSLLLTVLGLFLLLGGAKRSRRRRKEVKDLRRRADAPAGTATEDADQRGQHGQHGQHPDDGTPAPPPSRRRAGDAEVGEHFRGVPRD